MKKRVVFVSLVVATILASDLVPALGVFVGSGAGTFGTPTPSVGVDYGGVGTNTFNTGTSFTVTYRSNIVKFDGFDFSTPADTPFAVANLIYTNAKTVAGTSVDSVPIDIQMTFTEPLVIPNPVFRFWFDFDITNNTTDDPWLDADFFILRDSFSETFFLVGGDLYTLELLGFSSDGGSTITSSLTLPEEQTVDTDLYAQFVIPEPTGLVLFGMAGFALLRRRREIKCRRDDS